MAKWLTKLMSRVLLASCVFLVFERVSWLIAIWRSTREGIDFTDFESPSSYRMFMFEVSSGAKATEILIVALLLAITTIFYGSKLTKESQASLLSVGSFSVLYSMIIIAMQILVVNIARLYVGRLDAIYTWQSDLYLDIGNKKILLLGGVDDPHYFLLVISIIIMIVAVSTRAKLKEMMSDIFKLLGR